MGISCIILGFCVFNMEHYHITKHRYLKIGVLTTPVYIINGKPSLKSNISDIVVPTIIHHVHGKKFECEHKN